MARINISSGSPYEKPIGFSRGVRIGNIIALAGTAPIAAGGGTACEGNCHGQTRRCLEIIQEALEAAGGRLEDIIRTRVMLTDIRRWKEVAKAHGEVFGEIRPACTFMEVSRLIDDDWLVEIEADAVIGSDDTNS